MQSKIPLSKGDSLVTMRAKNTEVCVRLCECAIDMYKRNKKLLSVPQLERGRYYSAMPNVLKKICKDRNIQTNHALLLIRYLLKLPEIIPPLARIKRYFKKRKIVF